MPTVLSWDERRHNPFALLRPISLVMLEWILSFVSVSHCTWWLHMSHLQCMCISSAKPCFAGRWSSSSKTSDSKLGGSTSFGSVGCLSSVSGEISTIDPDGKEWLCYCQFSDQRKQFGRSKWLIPSSTSSSGYAPRINNVKHEGEYAWQSLFHPSSFDWRKSSAGTTRSRDTFLNRHHRRNTWALENTLKGDSCFILHSMLWYSLTARPGLQWLSDLRWSMRVLRTDSERALVYI